MRLTGRTRIRVPFAPFAPFAPLALFAGLIVCSLSACGVKTPPSTDGPALAQVKVENGGVAVSEPFAHLPVPPEDGPKIAPTVMVTPVLAAPQRGAPPI